VTIYPDRERDISVHWSVIKRQ